MHDNKKQHQGLGPDSVRANEPVRLAGQILKMASGKESVAFPPSRELAKTFRTSEYKVLQALRVLSQRGLANLRLRKSAQLSNAFKRVHIAERKRRGAIDTVCDRLREEITTGRFGYGARLPQVTQLSKTYRCSNTTLIRALGRLIDQNVLYKEKGHYRVGTAAGAMSPLSEATILIICKKRHFWKYLFNNEWHGPLVQTLAKESERRRIRTVMFEWGRSHSGQTADKRLAATIKKLGGAYLGSVVYVSDPRADEELRAIARALSFVPQKAVWYGRDLNRFTESNLRNQFYCLANERLTAELVTNLFWKLGFTRAAYVYSGEEEWIQTRLKQLQAAARKPKKIHYESRKHLMLPTWSGSTDELNDDMMELAQMRIPAVRRSLKRITDWSGSRSGVISPQDWRKLRKATETNDLGRGSLNDPHLEEAIRYMEAIRSLRPLWRHEEPTAFLAPNDSQAFSFHLNWLSALRLEAGRDVPLLAFDNSFKSYFSNLSTIDTGLDELGHRILHFLLGDVPVKPDSGNTFYPHPRFVDRGSIREAKQYSKIDLLARVRRVI